MNKELKDYLHLYLNADCERTWYYASEPVTIHSKNIIKVTGSLISHPFGTHSPNIAPVFDLKLILRPLASMTEEECFNLLHIQFDRSISHAFFYEGYISYQIQSRGGGRYWNKSLSFNQLTPEQCRYLLSKHFDLFNLIPSGLALDKTSLNQ